MGKLITPGGQQGPKGDAGTASNIPLADITQNGLLRKTSGNITDFVDGTNNYRNLASAIPAGSFSVFIEVPTVKTYVLDLDAPSPYTVIKYSAILTAGTATISLLLNGAAITGATGIAVSATLATGTLSQAVATGNTLSLQITAQSSAANLSLAVRTQ